jgi:hypothetical protein
MANNTYTKTYADGAALTEAKLDTSFQSLKLDVSNTDVLTTGSTSGQVFTSNGSGTAASFQTIADPVGPGYRNLGLSATTSSGSLTVAVKTNAGTNPTSSDSTDVVFSSSGTSSTVGQKFNLTTSLSLTLTASATLGLATVTTSALYVYAVRVSSTTLRLALSSSGQLDYGAKQATTAMSSSADTDGVLYSNASAGTYPVKLIGVISASHTNGSWNAIYSVGLLTSSGQRLGKFSSRAAKIITTALFVEVTAAQIVYQCSGRPIRLEMVASPTGSTVTDSSFIRISRSGSSTGSFGYIQWLRDATQIGLDQIGVETGASVAGYPTVTYPASAFSVTELAPPPGSHTFKLKISNNSGESIIIRNIKVLIREL